MRWRPNSVHIVWLSAWICSLAGDGSRMSGVAAMSTKRRLELRDLVKETWYHAMNSYMEHAYPSDELRPLTCEGLTRDGTTNEHEINDVMGGYSLTLIDALDTFVLMGDKSGFEKAVKTVIRDVSFDLDAKVQVFEVTIRVLGGLLSAHIFASTPKHGYGLDWYQDELLHMAHDLGRRLLPAFEHSLTGIPWPRVNLRHGLGRSDSMETCSAAAGSLLLEFATLSRLTGDPVFERVARKALFQVWNRRSSLSLLGNTLNMQTGQWMSTTSTTGAGVDSFFEYLAKAYILLGDDEYYRIWTEAYAAVMKWSRSKDGFWYRSVHMDNGNLVSANVDSLAAFFPGLQVLMGDIEAAIKAQSVFAMLWERFSGSPEVFNTQARRAEGLAWPLRPELMESTLFLYQATKDDSYLRFGERVILDVVNRTKVPCGLAALENVETGEQQNRMHSFVVSETLPYLYLLFDNDNPVNQGQSNAIFTTEGHYLILDKKYHIPPPKSRKGEASNCPKYRSGRNANDATQSLLGTIAVRSDMEYARSLVGLNLNETEALRTGVWSPSGFCESPSVEDYVMTLLFSHDGKEDHSPALTKLQPLQDGRNGYMIRSIQNIRLEITRRLGERGGYDVTKVGPYRVSSSATVFIADPAVVLTLLATSNAAKTRPDAAPSQLGQITLRFLSQDGSEQSLPAIKAGFGPDMSMDPQYSQPMHLYFLPNGSAYGCHHYAFPPFAASQGNQSGRIVVVAQRGECTFASKMKCAIDAGAAAVVVLSDEEDALVPSASRDELTQMTRLIPLVLMPRSSASQLRDLAELSAERITMEVSRTPDWAKLEPPPENDLARTPVIVNGYWLANCKLSR